MIAIIALLSILLSACAPPPKPPHELLSIVADGDSLTAGYYNSLGPGSYPAQLGVILGIAGTQIFNRGIAGAKTSDIIKDHIAADDSLYVMGADNWYVLWAGFNNFNTPIPDEETYAEYAQIVQGRRARGFRVMVLTLTPADLMGQRTGFPPWRLAFDAWLKNGESGADYICDSGDQDDVSDVNDLTLYSDRLHMTTEGYRRIASFVAGCFDDAIK